MLSAYAHKGVKSACLFVYGKLIKTNNPLFVLHF